MMGEAPQMTVIGDERQDPEMMTIKFYFRCLQNYSSEAPLMVDRSAPMDQMYPLTGTPQCGT